MYFLVGVLYSSRMFLLVTFWVPCYKTGVNTFQEGELTHLIRRFENLFYKKEAGDVKVR